jgi:hypothetical protein
MRRALHGPLHDGIGAVLVRVVGCKLAVLDETQKMCAFLVLLLHKSTPIRPRPSALETPHAFGPGAADGRLLPTRNATPTPVAVTMASSGPA